MDLKFKTLTLKISGLSVTKRVFNHKSIPIYYVDKLSASFCSSITLFMAGKKKANSMPTSANQLQEWAADVVT